MGETQRMVLISDGTISGTRVSVDGVPLDNVVEIEFSANARDHTSLVSMRLSNVPVRLDVPAKRIDWIKDACRDGHAPSCRAWLMARIRQLKRTVHFLRTWPHHTNGSDFCHGGIRRPSSWDDGVSTKNF